MNLVTVPYQFRTDGHTVYKTMRVLSSPTNSQLHCLKMGRLPYFIYYIRTELNYASCCPDRLNDVIRKFANFGFPKKERKKEH